MSEWTHRICERCWFDGGPFAYDPQHPNMTLLLEPPGVLEDGAYRQPVQVKETEPGACCVCGGMTITEIFFRRDPRELRCGGRHSDLSWSRVSTQ